MLHQDLADWARGDSLGCQLHEGIAVWGNAGPLSSEDEGGADHDWEPNPIGDFDCLFKIVRETRLGDLQSNFGHRSLELVAVFCCLDGLRPSADDFCAITLGDTLGDELHREVQRSLTPQSWKDCVRAFFGDDGLKNLDVKRFNVDSVCCCRVRHDGGGVRISQHHSVALLSEHPTGLCSRIVKFAGLADDDGP